MRQRLRQLQRIVWAGLLLMLVVLALAVASEADLRMRIMALEKERAGALADLLYEMIETQDAASRKRLSNVLAVAFRPDLKADSCLREVLFEYAEVASDKHGNLSLENRRRLKVMLQRCRGTF